MTDSVKRTVAHEYYEQKLEAAQSEKIIIKVTWKPKKEMFKAGKRNALILHSADDFLLKGKDGKNI